MARSLNKVMLIGNLGKDAETRHTPGGTAVTNFSLATAYRTKDSNTGEWQERTDWHDVVVWRAENVAPYLKKGTNVFVEGRLQTRSWEDQSGQKRYRTEVICDSSFGLMLLGGRQGGSAPAQATSGQGNYGSRNEPPPQPAAPPQPAPATPAPEPAGSMGGMDDDDIPF